MKTFLLCLFLSLCLHFGSNWYHLMNLHQLRILLRTFRHLTRHFHLSVFVVCWQLVPPNYFHFSGQLEGSHFEWCLEHYWRIHFDYFLCNNLHYFLDLSCASYFCLSCWPEYRASSLACLLLSLQWWRTSRKGFLILFQKQNWLTGLFLAPRPDKIFWPDVLVYLNRYYHQFLNKSCLLEYFVREGVRRWILCVLVNKVQDQHAHSTKTNISTFR